MKNTEANRETASGKNGIDYNWRNFSRVEVEAVEITDLDAMVDTLGDDLILAESNKQFNVNCPGSNPNTMTCFYSKGQPVPLPVIKEIGAIDID
jgi:hypothetical protein